MARGKRSRADSNPSSNNTPSTPIPNPMNIQRRRSTLRELQAATTANSNANLATDGEAMTPKIIDARPSLEKAEMYGIDDSRPASSRIMALIARLFIETIPAWLAVGAMLALIFGGCCSNVFALEAIVKVEPDSGTLLTFVQFVFVAVTGYVSQFDRSGGWLCLKRNEVPIRRWLVNIVLFFTINVLNNHAFSYNISVPIHIILRSGGSITTLVAGYIWGKRFTRIQIVAVTLLTVGVVVAAWSDQQSKKDVQTEQSLPPFSTGLGILFLAQVLSAIMGLYTEETYKKYGPHWKENLFYSHLLALPLFLPFLPSMRRQLIKLAASPPLGLPSSTLSDTISTSFPSLLQKDLSSLYIPSQLVYLVMNVLTQYACIRGVNLLAASASALTVTIVLNVRKLVSLLLSIWLFGNQLSGGTLVGAAIVFASGGLYGLEGSKKPRRHRARSVAVNGKVASG